MCLDLGDRPLRGIAIRNMSESRCSPAPPKLQCFTCPNTEIALSSKVITLLDDDRSETYATLDEAIGAAQNWYAGLAGDKLPAWDYRIESLQSFRRAVSNHKLQIAEALGYSTNRLHLRIEASSDSWFLTHK